MILNCKKCKKEFKTSPYKIKKGLGKFCSIKCFNLNRMGTKRKLFSEEHRKKLSQAGKNKIFTNEHKKHLSEAGKKKPNMSWLGKKHTEEQKRKISDAQKKEKHWNWKGGITPLNNKLRTSLEIKLWRKSNMERDEFTCQKCKDIGGKLQVHHINNFADFPELRTSIENGITFCIKCHQEFHKKYGKKNNTREQLQEFLSPQQ